MSEKFSDRTEAVIKAAFDRFSHHDNELTAEELVAAMRCMGSNVTLEKAQCLIAKHDKNKNGTMQLDEFRAMMVSTMKIKMSFCEIDKTGNGFIEKQEFKDHLAKKGVVLTEEELDDFMLEVDTDGDGKVNLSEFARFYEMLRQQDQEQGSN